MIRRELMVHSSSTSAAKEPGRNGRELGSISPSAAAWKAVTTVRFHTAVGPGRSVEHYSKLAPGLWTPGT